MRPRSILALALAIGVVAVAAVLAAVSGLGDDKPSRTANTAPPSEEPASGPLALPSTSEAPPSSAPSSCQPTAGGTYNVAGRSYLLAVPAKLTGPAPLVLDFHGYQQSATAQEAYTGFARYAAGRGVIVATPQGQPGGQWNFPRSGALADDVVFSAAVVDDVKRRVCNRVSAVGATGWSDGADMAMTLGCVGKVRAVAAEGASIVPRGSCNQPLPPVLELHGTADPFVPYTGGGGSRSGAFAGTTAQAAEGRLAIWATQSGCASSPTSTQVAADVTRLDWGRCATLYRMDGAGHGWPGHTGPDPVGGLGPTSSSVNASQLMTDFFLARLR